MKKRILYLLLSGACLVWFQALTFDCFAQPDSTLPGFGKKDFRIAATKPVFPGGAAGLFKWIESHTDLTALEAAMKEEGLKPKRYMARFWVQPDGSVMNHEIIALPRDGSSPVANVLLDGLRSIPKFKEVARDAYDNPAAFNYVIPIWPYGNKLLVGEESYLRSDLVRTEDGHFFGSFPFTGQAMEYYPDGKKKMQVGYLSGRLHGKTFFWDEKGIRLYWKEYDRDLLVACYDENGGECRLQCAEGTPLFYPGLDSLERFREQNLKYPLGYCGTGGRVMVRVQINRDSTLFSARILEATPGYGIEAMDYVHSLPDAWAPCRIRNRPVNTWILYPVEFIPHVNHPDSLSYRNGLGFYHNQLFSGWVFTAGPQLQKLSKGKMLKGLKEGVWKVWDKENRPVISQTYVHNVKSGEELQWDTLGRQTGIAWWENEARQQAITFDYWGRGKHLKSETTLFEDGTGQTRGYYDLPELTQWSYGELKKAQPDSVWTWWYPSGELQSQGTYEAGKKVGKWSYYSVDGTELGSLTYQEGKEQAGVAYSWWPNGTLKSKSLWKKGKKHGISLLWDQEGKVSEKQRWKKGIQK